MATPSNAASGQKTRKSFKVFVRHHTSLSKKAFLSSELANIANLFCLAQSMVPFESWIGRFLVLMLVVVAAAVLGALIGHAQRMVIVALLGWIVLEWISIVRIARDIELGRWPTLEGFGAGRRLLRAGRARLKRARARSRRLSQMLLSFRAAASAFPDGTLVIDGNGTLRWFNKQAAELLGLSYPGDLGRVLVQLLRHPSLVAWLDSNAGDEQIGPLPSSKRSDLPLMFSRLRYADDATLIVVRDVRKVVRLEQTRRDFVANVSHELRTPLTVINGYLDEIADEDVPQLSDVLAPMREQSRRMVRIVEDLLTLSRLDSKDRLSEQKLDLEALMRNLWREALALSGGRQRLTLRMQAPKFVLGGEKELISAFSNLVSNAVRYTPEGGSIQMAMEVEHDTLCFSVQDSGIGIAPEHIPRLTERFYRVSDSRSRETGGTGLGLAIVKHVLELHQGRLEVHSELGKGSCFSALLPLARGLGETQELMLAQE
jgi:two-component system phosphate regulon sensor histidine kinase PhoR